MEFKRRTLMALAEMICGNGRIDETAFVYRSSSYLTRFFEDAELEQYVHDGSTRNYWVADRLKEILSEPHADASTPPDSFLRVIRTLMDQEDAQREGRDRPRALEMLNGALAREGFEAFYGDDKQCYLRNIKTRTVLGPSASPHRPFSPAEQEKREKLSTYLGKISEDELIEEVLVPLFRQLGFHRVSAAGHKDKALEYGKDLWMKFTLPTQHVIYFGIQAKKDKLDSAGATKLGNVNVAEVLAQVQMMLGHEIFDPETSRSVLVDHAFVVAGGEITKAAKNWIGGKLDASKRSQVMFMDREDILNLFVATNIPLPKGALPPAKKPAGKFDDLEDDIPF